MEQALEAELGGLLSQWRASKENSDETESQTEIDEHRSATKEVQQPKGAQSTHRLRDEQKERVFNAERARYEAVMRADEAIEHLHAAYSNARDREMQEAQAEHDAWQASSLLSFKPKGNSCLHDELSTGYMQSEGLLVPSQALNAVVSADADRRRPPSTLLYMQSNETATAMPEYARPTVAMQERAAVRAREDARSHNRLREREKSRKKLSHVSLDSCFAIQDSSRTSEGNAAAYDVHEEGELHDVQVNERRKRQQLSPTEREREERVLRSIQHRSNYLEAASTRAKKGISICSTAPASTTAAEAPKRSKHILPSLNVAFDKVSAGGTLSGSRKVNERLQSIGSSPLQAKPAKVLFEDFEPDIPQVNRVQVRNMTSCSLPVRFEPPEHRSFTLKRDGKQDGRNNALTPGLALRIEVELLAESVKPCTSHLVASTPLGDVSIPLEARRKQPNIDVPRFIDIPATFAGGPVVDTSLDFCNAGGAGKLWVSPQAENTETALSNTSADEDEYVCLGNGISLLRRVLRFIYGHEKNCSLPLRFEPHRWYEDGKVEASFAIVDETGDYSVHTIRAHVVAPKVYISEGTELQLNTIDADTTAGFNLSIQNASNLAIPVRVSCRRGGSEENNCEVQLYNASSVVSPHSSHQVETLVTPRGVGKQQLKLGLEVSLDGGHVFHKLQTCIVSFYAQPVNVDFAPLRVYFAGGVRKGETSTRELFFINQSAAHASFNFTEAASTCGCIQLNPASGVVPPKSRLLILASATSQRAGSAQLDTTLQVENCESMYCLKIDANFKGPQLKPGDKWINFGKTMLGRAKEATFDVKNPSALPVDFKLQTPEHLSVTPKSTTVEGYGRASITVQLLDTAPAGVFREVLECVPIGERDGHGFFISIAASIIESHVYLETSHETLGELYVGNSLYTSARAVNLTSLPVTLEPEHELLAEEWKHGPGLASVAVIPPEIHIPANESVDLAIRLDPLCDGTLDALLAFDVEGTEKPCVIPIKASIRSFSVELYVERTSTSGDASVDALLEPYVLDAGECQIGEQKQLVLLVRNSNGVSSAVETAQVARFYNEAHEKGLGIHLSASPTTWEIGQYSDLRINLTFEGTFPGEYSDELALDIGGLPTQRIELRASVIGSAVIASNQRILDTNLKAACKQRAAIDFGVNGLLDPSLSLGTLQRNVYMKNISPLPVCIQSQPHKYGAEGDQDEVTARVARIVLEHIDDPDSCNSVCVYVEPVPRADPGPFGLAMSSQRQRVLAAGEQMKMPLTFSRTWHGACDGTLCVQQWPASHLITSTDSVSLLLQQRADGSLKCLLEGTWTPYAAQSDNAGLPDLHVALRGQNLPPQIELNEQPVRFVHLFASAQQTTVREVLVHSKVPFPMKLQAMTAAPFAIGSQVQHLEISQENRQETPEIEIAPYGVKRLRLLFQPHMCSQERNDRHQSPRNQNMDYKVEQSLSIRMQGRAMQTFRLIGERKRAEVEASVSEIMFGSCHISSKREAEVVLRNPTNVQCEWEVFASSPFSVHPVSSGVLDACGLGRPKQQRLKIRYEPRSRGVHAQQLLFQVKHGGRGANVWVYGEGSLDESLR